MGKWYQCPLGLVLHFYADGIVQKLIREILYQCPFWLMLHFYVWRISKNMVRREVISMPSRADAPFLQEENGWTLVPPILVSMPFRAGASFLQLEGNPFEEANTMYQCPLGLVLHFYIAFIIILVVIAAAMYQCPFRLVLHFYNASEESHFVAEKNVSMPFRASASFLRIFRIRTNLRKR